jgi:hypothetical protein
LIEVEARIRSNTGAAWVIEHPLVERNERSPVIVYLPHSVVDLVSQRGEWGYFEVPDWLAHKEGLIE